MKCALSVSAAVVQWTKRKIRKTEDVSSNLSSISLFFFPIKILFALNTQEICDFCLLLARTVYDCSSLITEKDHLKS